MAGNSLGRSETSWSRRVVFYIKAEILSGSSPRSLFPSGSKCQGSGAIWTPWSHKWTQIGPQPISGNPNQAGSGSSAVSGHVESLAIDRRNTNVVYLGADVGGVWKTSDGGQTWVPLTDSQPSLAIGSLALDPSNPDVVYAGTGDGALYGAGILKSTDGGSTSGASGA